MQRFNIRHIRVVLHLFRAHYRQAPLQAAAIVIGIVLAVTLFVAVQAINLNAKRSYAESTEQLSAQATHLVLPLSGQRYLSQSLYFLLRQHGLSDSLPVIEGRVSDSKGRSLSVQGSDLIAAISSIDRNKSTATNTREVSIFNDGLPIAELLMGKPIILMSQSQFVRMGSKAELILNDIKTQVIPLPDEWQLGNRLLTDISFAQQLLKKPEQLSYIAVFEGAVNHKDKWIQLLNERAKWVSNNQSADLRSLTDSFHLNLTAMSLLAFLVGLFIAYNGVRYSLLKRNRLLVQIQQAGLTPSNVIMALFIELTFLVLIGATLGFILGIQLSHWLHPTVALTLEQLYGATLLPDTWQWQWWAQALLLTLIATLAACWQHFNQRVHQPLSSHGGFYQAPSPSNENTLFLYGVALTTLSLLGMWFTEHHRFTMFWLGILVISIPLYLPKSLLTLARLSDRKTSPGLLNYLFAELRELISPLSLAMMALLLAVTANIGMNTLVGSFESTLKRWLEQKLHADIYISPTQAELAQLDGSLEHIDNIEKVYKQFYVNEHLQGLPIILGTKDEDSLAQTLQLKAAIPDFWQQFYADKVAAISEPTAIKLGLSLGSELKLEAFQQPILRVGAIFYDYGSPNGEVLISPQLWKKKGFTDTPTSLGVKVSGEHEVVLKQLEDQLNLHPSQLYEQSQIITIALNIFSQTFAITRALNGVTLMVAVIGLFSSCFMLLEARKASIARLYALGISRRKLMYMTTGQIVALVTFTLLIALPLGALVGYVLTDIVTLRAFGWSLHYLWRWEDALSIAVMTILIAVIATLLPLWRLVSQPMVSSLQSEVM